MQISQKKGIDITNLYPDRLQFIQQRSFGATKHIFHSSGVGDSVSKPSIYQDRATFGLDQLALKMGPPTAAIGESLWVPLQVWSPGFERHIGKRLVKERSNLGVVKDCNLNVSYYEGVVWYVVPPKGSMALNQQMAAVFQRPFVLFLR